jgi:pseudaminic acid biosynthesis-associated methylase
VKTEQEEFWQGNFGNRYISRNQDESFFKANLVLWKRIFRELPDATSALEFGCNIGLNLKAIHNLLPKVDLAGIEINPNAVEQLQAWGVAQVFPGSILNVEPDQKFDLTFSKGVLIHIAPPDLPDTYRRLYDWSRKYICVIEYYNPTPVALSYRGHANKLFKRDFAGDLLDYYPDLKLVDYGFFYHRDEKAPQDDLSWFLLKKRGG